MSTDSQKIDVNKPIGEKGKYRLRLLGALVKKTDLLKSNEDIFYKKMIEFINTLKAERKEQLKTYVDWVADYEQAEIQKSEDEANALMRLEFREKQKER